MVVVGHGMRTGAHLANWALKAAVQKCQMLAIDEYKYHVQFFCQCPSHDPNYNININ